MYLVFGGAFCSCQTTSVGVLLGAHYAYLFLTLTFVAPLTDFSYELAIIAVVVCRTERL